MNDIETAIRNELKIPDEAQHVVILSMDAHMDWDWLYNFQPLVEGQTTYSTAQEIVTKAFTLMAEHQNDTYPYYYSICEIGFLQAVVGLSPALLQQFAQRIGDKLRIVGGGMTSPDNLLSHGEAFIRSYLLGKTWLDANLGLPLRQAYLPDDFGHDSQLPIVLQAMGFQGVSFSRIPGSAASPSPGLPNGQPTLADQLWTGSADFVWQAADGSSIVAHWMQHTYCQGNGIEEQQGVIDNLQGYIYGAGDGVPADSGNIQSSPTPYIYVPCGCDFALPLDGLLADAALWNQTNYSGKPGDVFAVVATLDHYLQLIATYADSSATHQYGPYTNLQTRSFVPTPYWTGFYASRPANKIWHQAATRSLLGAETFAKIADVLQTADALAWQPAQAGRNASIQAGWATLVPSTHHDFISGTATDDVYTSEQLPLLQAAAMIGASAQGEAISAIAGLVQMAPQPGETPVVLFNQLGFAHSGLAELPARIGFAPQSARLPDGQVGPVQRAADGALLLMGSAPSMGYGVAYLSPTPAAAVEPLSYSAAPDGSSYTLENAYLTATISKAANWGLESLVDKGGREMIAPGNTGNDLAFYIDKGGLYCFGNEYGRDSSDFQIDPQGSLSTLDATLVESGPLRLRLRTAVQFQSQDGSGTPIGGIYVREYTLVAGEPFLRMSVTGAAPLTSDGQPNGESYWQGNPYAVMLRFPFADPQTGDAATVATMTYGTPYHWVTQMPEPYWSAPIFQATHNFVLPQTAAVTIAGIYHADIPAWAIDGQGAVIGCVLRNTPQDQAHSHGANGSDTGTHTHHYALRVPTALGDPTSAQPLREALSFQTVLQVAYGNAAPNLPFPSSFSLAQVTSGPAILTAAKAGEADPAALVLRVYQPTNNPGGVAPSVTIDLSDFAGTASLQAQRITALEAEIAGENDLPTQNASVTFLAERAITTLRVETAP